MQLNGLGCNPLTVSDTLHSLMETDHLRIFRHVSSFNDIYIYIHIYIYIYIYIHNLSIFFLFLKAMENQSRCNRIDQVSQLLFLGGCTALQQVAFQEASDNGNSICDDPIYRSLALRVPRDTQRYQEYLPILANSQAFGDSVLLDWDSLGSTPKAQALASSECCLGSDCWMMFPRTPGNWIAATKGQGVRQGIHVASSWRIFNHVQSIPRTWRDRKGVGRSCLFERQME